MAFYSLAHVSFVFCVVDTSLGEMKVKLFALF